LDANPWSQELYLDYNHELLKLSKARLFVITSRMHSI